VSFRTTATFEQRLLVVHHGRIFGTYPPSGSNPVSPTLPSTPTNPKEETILPLNGLEVTTKIHPYICYGFKIQDSLVYISDVSHIPEDIWTLLDREREDCQPYPILVLDCLRLLKHTSHFGIMESVTAARRMGAKRTYFTGFSHDVSHEEYETILKVINGEDEGVIDLTENERDGISLVDEGKPMWMRPAFDGLRVCVSRDGNVVDEGYP
jgi:phosphoribosyl 1,2-cyclic phosphodiesterase